MSPRTIAWSGSIWLPNAPARRISSTASTPEVVHQQPDAGVERGLGELDRADVVLGDRDPRPAVGRLVQDVGERPAVGDDPRRPRGERAVDDAVGGDDAGEEQLGDDLDDPGAADAGDRRSSADASAKPGSSDQASTPMTRKRGSSVSRSIRTRSMAPGAARWPPLIWAPSKAGPVGLDAASSRSPVAQHDLGVRADVDDERDALGPVRLSRRGSRRPCRRRRGRRCTAGRRPGRRGAARRPSSRGRRPDRPVGGQRERRRAERRSGRCRAARWCMIGLPTSASSRIVVALDRRPASRAPATRPSSASRTAAVISPAPSGASSRTRRGSSGPRRSGSAGSSRRLSEDLAVGRGRRGGRRWWSSRCRWRRRRRVSWRPGQTAMTCAAVVDGDRDAVADRSRAPAGAPGRPSRSASRPVRPHSRSSASSSRARSPVGEASSGGVDLDVVEAHDRIDRRSRGRSRPLRTTWRWTWLSGGTSIDDVAADRRGARRGAGPRPGPCRSR